MKIGQRVKIVTGLKKGETGVIVATEKNVPNCRLLKLDSGYGHSAELTNISEGSKESIDSDGWWCNDDKLELVEVENSLKIGQRVRILESFLEGKTGTYVAFAKNNTQKYLIKIDDYKGHNGNHCLITHGSADTLNNDGRWIEYRYLEPIEEVTEEVFEIGQKVRITDGKKEGKTGTVAARKEYFCNDSVDHLIKMDNSAGHNGGNFKIIEGSTDSIDNDGWWCQFSQLEPLEETDEETKQREFDAVVTPVIEYLEKNGDPYLKVIITQSGAELVGVTMMSDKPF